MNPPLRYVCTLRRQCIIVLTLTSLPPRPPLSPLLKLSEKVNFNENVRPINLASRTDHLLPQRCIVSGWGFTSEDNQNFVGELREVNLTLAKDTSCPEPHAFFSLGEIGPSHVSDKNIIHVYLLIVAYLYASQK